MKTNTLPKVATLATACILTILSAHADIGSISLKTSAAGLNALETTIGSNQITIETWLYIDDNTGFFASNMHNDKGFVLGFDGWFKFQLDGESLWIDPTSWKGNWTHIACVADGSQIIVYVNGEVVGSQSNIAGYDTAADGYPLYLGRAPWGNPCICKMADFRLWSVARTPDEIKDNYQKQIDPSTEGLIKNFNFAEGSGDHTVNLADPEGNQAWCMGTIDTDYSWETVAATPANLRIENKADHSFDLLWDGTEGNTWSVELLDGDQTVESRTNLTEPRASFTNLDQKVYTARVKAHSFMETDFSEPLAVDLSPVSSIEQIASSVSIIRQSKSLHITGIPNGTRVALYSSQGILCVQTTAGDQSAVIETSGFAHGIYIVQIEGVNKSYKVAL